MTRLFGLIKELIADEEANIQEASLAKHAGVAAAGLLAFGTLTYLNGAKTEIASSDQARTQSLFDSGPLGSNYTAGNHGGGDFTGNSVVTSGEQPDNVSGLK
jgi:hypothetical protein